MVTMAAFTINKPLLFRVIGKLSQITAVIVLASLATAQFLTWNSLATELTTLPSKRESLMKLSVYDDVVIDIPTPDYTTWTDRLDACWWMFFIALPILVLALVVRILETPETFYRTPRNRMDRLWINAQRHDNATISAAALFAGSAYATTYITLGILTFS